MIPPSSSVFPLYFSYPQGPIWYKGLLPLGEGRAEPGQITALLEAFQVKRMVVGHQVLDQVRAFHGGRVFGIDAGMERGDPGELWIWDGERPWRGRADGSRLPLDGPQAPMADAPAPPDEQD